jgi:hypothetical protein
MKKYLFYTFILLTCLILSCRKDAEIDLPQYSPTLTIHSYISPLDSGVTVYVNISKPAYNNSFNDPGNVTDATVKISDGIHSAALSYRPGIGKNSLSYYFIDSSSFKIVVGQTYTLNITTPDGKAASATTTIPEIVNINSLSYEEVAAQFGDSAYRIKVGFHDPAGKDDYYKFGAYVLNIDSNINMINSSSSTNFSTYFNKDGSEITDEMMAFKMPAHSQPPGIVNYLDFRLYHVSREFYIYHQSIEGSRDNGPFTEPSVPFTNITGGVGVFAGYNYDMKMIKL